MSFVTLIIWHDQVLDPPPHGVAVWITNMQTDIFDATWDKYAQSWTVDGFGYNGAKQFTDVFWAHKTHPMIIPAPPGEE